MVEKKSTRGFHDWMVQRVTAVLIAVYFFFLLGFLLCQPLNYPSWSGLFKSGFMQVATIVVLLAVLWHAWIGLWTVLTDYVKHTTVRFVLELIIGVLLVGYLFWTILSLNF